MRVLLIYPRFPTSFWSFEKTLALIGRKAMLPPLGLVTVAALLPQNWEFRLVDRNVRDVSEDDWAWAEIVMLSAMIVQKQDLLAQVRRAKQRGKPVVVGGPFPTSLPEQCSEADYLVLDEAEITVPQFLAALAAGDRCGVYRAGDQKPDVTHTPIPRYDLLNLDAYSEMSVQFSRGCPFRCEFCDIIVLYGRRPRTKTPAQMLAELQRLYDLGWRRSIFVVDDNFIGNKRNVRALLDELQPWMAARDHPFSFATEASLDLAQDPRLIQAMVACNFRAVFLGIETPDVGSLTHVGKTQNARRALADAVGVIAHAGLRVMAGFIIGFDGEKPGAGQRIVDFAERTATPTVAFSMLQALPGTALTRRLSAEGRLLDDAGGGDLNQTTLMNFVPTRAVEQIAREYIDAFWQLYDPQKYLDRVFRHYIELKDASYPRRARPLAKKLTAQNLRAVFRIFWKQGVVRKTRWRFWVRLYGILRANRRAVGSYLSGCAQGEHFFAYRVQVRDSIRAALLNQAPSQPRATEASCGDAGGHLTVPLTPASPSY